MVISDSLRSSLAYLATLGPIGHLRPAPGTIGSVAGVVSGYMIAICINLIEFIFFISHLVPR